MALQRRNLSMRMQGDDVRLLQQKLRRLGFSIGDKAGYFGKFTRKAVSEFQRRQGIEASDVVEAGTAKMIDAELVALEQGAASIPRAVPVPPPVPPASPAPAVAPPKPPARPGPSPASFIVHGLVREPDGKPVVGAVVRAVDKDLRTEEVLGETTTDPKGAYEITYTAEKFRRAEKQTADLIVRAFDRNKQLLAASPIVFNAKPEETVDLMVGGQPYRGLSEFDRYMGDVTLLLEGQGIGLSEFTPDDFVFVAGETGIPAQRVQVLVAAAKLSEKANLGADVFYGFAREALPTTLAALLAQSPIVLRRALETALRDNIIPPRSSKDVDAVLARLRQLVVDQAFEEPETPGEASLGALLATAVPSEAVARKFLSLYTKHAGPPEEFWKSLRSDPDFKAPGLVENLQLTFQLSALTLKHLPIVRELQDMKRRGTISGLRDLAKFEVADWLALIKKTVNGKPIGAPADVPGADDAERAANYAAVLTRIVAEAFPTAVIARKIEQDDIPEKADLLQFFRNNNPHFELGSTNIDQYVAANRDSALAGVQDPVALVTELKRLGRVFKLTPRYGEMRVLLSARLDSAHAISRVGHGPFIATFGASLGGEARASTIYARAQQTSALALALFGKYSPAFNSVALPVLARLPSGSSGTSNGDSAFPDWQTLFGSPDFCACEECGSVTSPAAYLVDLLHLLSDRRIVARVDDHGTVRYEPVTLPDGRDKTALDVLIDSTRRADLTDIELSCQNTKTPLPYIDLVNEILENAIAPFAPFIIALGPEGDLDLDNRSVSQAVRDAFAGSGITLSATHVVTVLEESSAWLLTDEGATTTVGGEQVPAPGPYLINKRADGLHVSLDMQTRWAAEELRANPEHVRHAVYTTLRDAVYPWDLPFDLSLAEVRLYLEHLGVPRYALMEAFRQPPSNVADLAVACEYLGISKYESRALDEYQIVTGTSPAASGDARDFFGLSGDDWVRTLRRLPELLRTTGASYNDMVELLKTHFVAPTGAIQPVSPAGAGCDVSQMTVPIPDQDTLSRLHRFVRLWRKSGWQIEELDSVLDALGATDGTAPNINDNVLKQIAHVKRLQRDLGLPLDQLLTFWADVGTQGTDPLYDRLFLNKAVLNPIDQDFQLNADRTDLAAAGGTAPLPTLTGHADAIRGALRISAAELDTVRAAVGLADDTAALNLAHLTQLYRFTLLANALLVSVDNLRVLLTLVGGTAFGSLDPAGTSDFLEKARKVRRSSFSIAQLRYLYQPPPETGVHPAPDPLAPSPYAVAEAIRTLQDALVRVAGDPDREEGVVTQTLGSALGLDAAMADLLLGSVLGSLRAGADSSARLIADFLSLGVNNRKGLEGVYATEGSAAPRLTRVDAQVAFDWEATRPDPALDSGAFTVRWTGKVMPRFSEPYTFSVPVNGHVRLWVGDTSASPLIDADSSGTALSATIPLNAARLYDIQLEYVSAPSAASVELRWSSPSTPDAVVPSSALFTDPGLTGDLFFRSYEQLYKGALLIKGFAISKDELAYLSSHSADFGGFDLNALPLDHSGFTTGRFRQWERLFDLFGLRSALPRSTTRLFDVFQAATAAATIDEVVPTVAAATGWNESALGALVTGPVSLNLVPGDFKDEIWLSRLQRAFVLSGRLGVAPVKLYHWATADPLSVAEDVKNTVKAKYDAPGWLAVAKPLRDALREQQRAALVSYLIANPSSGATFRDASDVFGHYLIDVEMSSCQLTSRIKQAIGSVQLFVQRCLVKLEPDVTLHQADASFLAQQWEWMRSYRVWEGARKVFLWPENLIGVMPRDDRSPFFRDLENELLQGDITPERVEQAYGNYLAKLDEVARLEIAGLYKQPAEDDTESHILHVFARTRGTPHVYFYRRRVSRCLQGRDSGHWTPWEKVDVDIDGDHLIPAVWNRRLFLFWPVFSEKSPPPETVAASIPASGDASTATAPPTPPQKYWEISLAWSEYRDGKWAAKKVSTTSLDTSTIDMQVRIGQPEPGVAGVVAARNDFFFKWIPSTPSAVAGAPGDSAELPAPRTISCLARVQLSDSSRRTLRLPSFIFDSCDGRARVDGRRVDIFSAPPPTVPPGARVDFMAYLEDPAERRGEVHDFEMPSAALDADGYIVRDTVENIPILARTPGVFRVAYPHQFPDFVSQAEFFYEDDTRTFFVTPERPTLRSPGRRDERLGVTSGWVAPNLMSPDVVEALYRYSQRGLVSPGVAVGGALPPGASAGGSTMSEVSCAWTFPEKQYRFEPFYHPYVCTFIEQMNRSGIEGLLAPDPSSDFPPRQAVRSDFFVTAYGDGTGLPALDLGVTAVDHDYPVADIDFDYDGAYSLYNWELFFHIPLLIADRLSQKAQQWYHYIFNPTDTSSDPTPQRYWNVRPLFEAGVPASVSQLLTLLAEGDPELEAQVGDWRRDPFNPYQIARHRHGAYQKALVMKYIDHLIARGDSLFRQNTLESINEATLLYVLAGRILGERPHRISRERHAQPRTFNDLVEVGIDAFADTLIGLEDYLSSAGDTWAPGVSRDGMPVLGSLYFCIPQNEKLLGYWDTVADRLFKIRHCMNIEGVVQRLPLFEPPIEPSLLARAAAAGVDIASALAEITPALPHYRYTMISQKALELCGDIKALGAALLSALEKRDAEALALLRSGQEVRLLTAVRAVKEEQVTEATRAREALDKTAEFVGIRLNYYTNIAFLNEAEQAHLQLLTLATTLQAIGQITELAAGGAYAFPQVTVGVTGVMGTPVATATIGGANAGSGMEAFGKAMSFVASQVSFAANLSSIIGGYQRRADEWHLQRDVAAKELEQVKKQIDAADIRLQIVQRELDTHDLQIDNARQVDEFMRNKFTNQELYDWMVLQLSAVYFQSYQLAYDMAKRAEKTCQFELANPDASFIQFGYWDNLKQGLLAGEKLYYDLKRMEAAYLDQNKREYEITKHVSLAMLDPVALVLLKQTGNCVANLPEEIFDLDYPGHYLRRIKSVSLTVPCVIGPYTTVNCTLTLTEDRVRKNNSLLNGSRYEEADTGGDPRFIYETGSTESVVTSHAQADSGLFEANLRDERYLPFEGTGAISHWLIELPQNFRQFDYDTITDVILHLRYTARYGGDQLKNAAKEALSNRLNAMALGDSRTGLVRLFSAKHEFPSEWHRFLHPADTTVGQTLQLDLSPERFPFVFRDKTVRITKAGILLRLKAGVPSSDGTGTQFVVTYPTGSTPPTESFRTNLNPDDALGGLLYAENRLEGTLGSWSLEVTHIPDALRSEETNRLNADAIEDMGMICYYSLSLAD